MTSVAEEQNVIERRSGSRAFAEFLGGLEYDEHVTGGWLSRE